jgi:hypothetical protein
VGVKQPLCEKMTAPPRPAVGLRIRTHIDPPNKVPQERKTKFGATLTDEFLIIRYDYSIINVALLLRPDTQTWQPYSSPRKWIKLALPDIIDGKALNEREVLTGCNVCVSILPAPHLLIPISDFCSWCHQ